MNFFLLFFAIFSILFIFVDCEHQVRRIRKFVRPHRSAADDALDIEAAELIFKEKAAKGNIETKAPPAPIEDDNAKEAPVTEATDLSALEFEGSQEIKNNDEKALESSMISTADEETTTVQSIMRVGVHDGEASQPLLKWQRPLVPNGKLLPYDFNIQPDFPVFAPVARGLVGIPDGWNADKPVDEEFRRGFREGFRRRRY